MKNIIYIMIFFLLLNHSIFSQSQNISTENKTTEKTTQEEETSPPEIIFLKNGDKITGYIEKFEDNNLCVKAEQIGEIKIPWENVKGIKSVRILYFRMENGNIIAAQGLGIENDMQILDSPLIGKVKVKKEQILIVGTTEESVNPDYLRTKEELKETKEALKKATEIGELWSGYIEASFSGNEGNKNDRTFIAIGYAERKTDTDKFEAKLGIKYSSADRERVANEISGYLQEAIDVSDRFYIYGRLSGKWDEVNDIDFQFGAELGFGLHILREGDWEVFKGDKITFNLDVGGKYQGTDYSPPTEDVHTGGIVIRIIYQHIFPNEWKLTISGEYDQFFKRPNEEADKFDDYELKGEVALNIPITDVLSFTGSIKDEYKNVPAEGKKRNDFYWYLGLRITF